MVKVDKREICIDEESKMERDRLGKKDRKNKRRWNDSEKYKNIIKIYYLS